MVQLDPQHVIFVTCHPFNTFDKKQLLKTQGKSYHLTMYDCIPDEDLRMFFTVHVHLKSR